MKELTQEAEYVLWSQYGRYREVVIRNQIAEQYYPLVKYVAGKIVTGMAQYIEFGDLVSYGTFGLLDAIEKFDHSRKIKFKTYAIIRIRGAIYDELRSIDWIPRSIRQKAKELELIIVNLKDKLGRNAEDEEIAEELGVSVDDFQRILVKIHRTSLISIDDTCNLGDDSDKLSIIETIESPMSLNPDVIAEKKEAGRIAVEVLKRLYDNEKKVFILYYYEDLTLKEIGGIIGVTESRISQLRTSAIKRLKQVLGILPY